MSSDDIVQRLRNKYPDVVHPHLLADAQLIGAAANEIERLRAEVERLDAENAMRRRNEWRLVWGLCTECGRNRDQEARRERP